MRPGSSAPATGLTLAAAGIDNSNVAADSILLLAPRPGRECGRYESGWPRRPDSGLGVIISDTAGRPGGSARPTTPSASPECAPSTITPAYGDAYGNELQVTAMAVADEIAAAADLVKGKLRGRPVAVVRGLAHLVSGTDSAARELLRDPAERHVRLRQSGGCARSGAGSHGTAATLRGVGGARRRGTDFSVAGRQPT